MPGFDEDLMAALKGGETQETPAVEAPPPEAQQEAPPTQEAEQQPAAEQETPAQAAQRARDEAGRFAKKTATAETQKPPVAAAKPAQGQPPASPAPEAAQVSAPRSWAPAVREHWGAMPREVKDQILKREGEVSRVLNESQQARRFHQEFEAVAAPYKALFTAPPVQVAANLFQTAAALQTGDVPTKAGLVAQMIRNFGIPVEAVADALEGKQGGQQQQAPAYRDPRVDELLQRQQLAEQQAQQTVAAQAQQQLQAFIAAGTPDFFEDVREDMALLLETRRATTYEEAYRKACAMNEEIATVLAQRKAEEARRAQSQQAQQARHASGSVKSNPAPPAGSRKPTMDEALAAALGGR